MAGLILAAPASGSGKTTITLGLLRALRDQNVPALSAKSGPDYIDPRFHEAASGAPCPNLDAWAMTPERLRQLAQTPPEVPLIVEGAMGLFDGAPPDGRGASADLARILGLPVVLVVDCARMAGSVAAVVAGFANHDTQVHIGGVILNRIGSARHEAMLRRALGPLGLPILGAVPRSSAIELPSRHLGLVQAEEQSDLEAFLRAASQTMAAHLDIPGLLALAHTAAPIPAPARQTQRPPGQVIAIAQDRAFRFAYPHLLRDWQDAGATLRLFSPLADDAVPEADLIYLPGGYPELHADALAQSSRFMQSLRNAAQDTDIYGECGGYMLLGDSLTDAAGETHRMAGLLRLRTSFAQRKLHLGYRTLHASAGPFSGAWNGHEFHYATTLSADGPPLFSAHDAEGTALPPMGLRQGRTCGSFAHLIDKA
ncbi:cobyrinate a,c-diamide synthase [Flavimaricola marinus]|uniref:Hydrogenobyrinate a,c-diamide synthase n=1 Tax=Flavimaricola marinus TaxID=1819565 RepID=A0A238LE45_9RHOB|nr:cobyrinate a,c-diamide synthase [Flavimaricola marinus]SMY07987.1 Cobyrinic acid A,C-diamide synthase [Flavimaricola marinus]